MKTLNKIKAIAIIVLCTVLIIVVAKACRSVRGDNKPITHTEVSVKPTPVNLDSIKRIGQWSVVSVELYQIVDTVDKGFFSDDEIQVMYHGTLHYGVDLSKTKQDWIRIDNDSAVFIHLPDVSLLDNRFLDERDVKVIMGEEDQKFINRPEVQAALVRKAKAEMIRKGDTHKDEARKKIEADLKQLFTSHGYKQVMVFFE